MKYTLLMFLNKSNVEEDIKILIDMKKYGLSSIKAF